MPTRSNWPSILLSAAISRSPWNTRMVTACWPSSAVENTCDLLGRDRGVAVDQAGEHAAQRLDAERQRRHVEQQHVLDVALQHAGLDGGADGDDLVRIDALVRLLAEQLLHDLLDLRHARHAADQDHLVDLGRADRPASFIAMPARLDRLLHEVIDQRLELGAGELHGQMLRTRRIRRDERQVDLGLRGGARARSWPSRRLPSAAAARACRGADRCPGSSGIRRPDS